MKLWDIINRHFKTPDNKIEKKKDNNHDKIKLKKFEKLSKDYKIDKDNYYTNFNFLQLQDERHRLNNLIAELEVSDKEEDKYMLKMAKIDLNKTWEIEVILINSIFN